MLRHRLAYGHENYQTKHTWNGSLVVDFSKATAEYLSPPLSTKRAD